MEHFSLHRTSEKDRIQEARVMKKIFMSSLLAMTLMFSLQAADQKAAKKIRVPVTTVDEAGDFQTRHYPGKVVAIAQVNIISRVEGEILKVGFENGTLVQKGQILFELDDVKYRAAVKNVEAKIAEYKARILYASSKYERDKKLSSANAVSRDDMENSLSALQAYQAALEAANADLVAAQNDLAHTKITAPISGKIGTTNFTVGNYVTTASGPMVSLIQANPIRIRFSISNRDLLEMFGGKSRGIEQDGKITVLLSTGKEYGETGIIEYVENAANENTDTIQVYAKFQNADSILRPLSTVEVILSNKSGVMRPAIPHTAILQDIKGSFVWIIDNSGKAEKRYIKRGLATEDKQLILDGLQKGDRIVADGPHRVRQGDTIEAEQMETDSGK